MSAHLFIFIVSIWVGLGLVPLFAGIYFGLQMQNNRIPTDRPVWEMRGSAFPNSPANLTEIGLAYRDKSARAYLVFGGWVIVSAIASHFIWGPAS